MSRIGKKPIKIPSAVTVTIEGPRAHVKGPKGELETPIPDGVKATIDKGVAALANDRDDKRGKAMYGMARSLLANAVTGVSTGFQKELSIVGIGYKAAAGAGEITFNLGYSHPIVYKVPDGIEVKVEKNTSITVSGIDKQKVGQVAAEMRALRPPEPYKGKGVRYKDETIRRKVGKTGA